MQTLSESQRKFLGEAMEVYAADLEDSPAAYYLDRRGLNPSEASRMFRLGHVSNPLPSHERFKGMLAIPYIAKSGCVGFKFRRLDDGTPKYLAPEAQKVRLFNVLDALSTSDTIVICEGELDVVAARLAGVPAAVGVAGVQTWKHHFARVLDGFENILIVADNDTDKEQNPGQDLAKRILADIPYARNVLLPGGMDVNGLVLANGKESLAKALGLEATVLSS